MNFNKTKVLGIFLGSFLISLAAGGLVFAVSSYQDPTCGPTSSQWPNCNPDAPINTGSVAQTKGGDFAAENLAAADTLIVGGSSVLAALDGNVGIGMLGTPVSSIKLGVSGNIGGAQLCKLNGGFCLKTGELYNEGNDLLIRTGSRTGAITIGANGGIVPVNLYGTLNIKSVPVESNTGWTYNSVPGASTPYSSSYNASSPNFSWWQAQWPGEFPAGSTWDSIKIRNGVTNNECEDTSMINAQCTNTSYTASVSGPTYVYDLVMAQEINGNRFSIGYDKYEKRQTNYSGGDINAINGNFSSALYSSDGNFGRVDVGDLPVILKNGHLNIKDRDYTKPGIYIEAQDVDGSGGGSGASIDLAGGTKDSPLGVHNFRILANPSGFSLIHLSTRDSTTPGRNFNSPGGPIADPYAFLSASRQEGVRIGSLYATRLYDTTDFTAYVGIGTSTPTQELEVKGGIKAREFCLPGPTPNGDCITSWPSGTGNPPIVPPAGGGGLGGNGTTNRLAKWSNPNGLTSSGIFEADNGFVGIGSTSPQQLLHLDGKNADARILLEGDGSVGIRQAKTDLTGTGRWNTFVGTSGDPAVNGSLIFASTDDNFNNTTARLVINHGSGNVGIGTLRADARLHVVGNVMIQSAGNPGGPAFSLNPANGLLEVGSPTQSGDIFVKNTSGQSVIRLEGQTGRATASQFCLPGSSPTGGCITTWPVGGGSPSGVESSPSENGYLKIGNITIQWGKLNNGGSEQAFNVTFPRSLATAFNAQCTASIESSLSGADSTKEAWCQFKNFNSTGGRVTGITFYAQGTTSAERIDDLYWTVIGQE